MANYSQRGDIAAFLAMDVMREAHKKSRDGETICHMEVGQPGTKAPALVRERAHQALDEELIGYTEALGLPALRERIAGHYQADYGVGVDQEQIIVTTGSSGGFVLGFLATLDAGARVAITRPGYPCYRQILKALDLVPVEIELGFDNEWRPQFSDIERVIEQDGVEAILLASPANPTGAVLEDGLIRQISEFAAEKDVWLFMDEIYHGLIYDRTAGTAAGLNERTIVLNSFSKYYSMTGWRIGWMVVPRPLLRVLEKLNQHLFISAPALSQHAALAAFDARPELELIKAGYQANREALLEGLARAGISRVAPADGAFYIYADVSDFTDDSLAFSHELLETYGIAACPGIDFDEVNGRYMVRFSYAGAAEEVRLAMERLAERPLPRL